MRTRTAPPAPTVEEWNATVPPGTPVSYWTGVREGPGRLSTTRTPAQLLGGHTPTVWVDGHSGGIALTHVEPVPSYVRAQLDAGADPATIRNAGWDGNADPFFRTDPPPEDRWMQTFTGRAVDPFNATPDDIDPRDIAHALAMTCRYGGHTRWHYSVAQHSFLIARSVPLWDALWGLLHDAAETYLTDLISPIKHLMPGYKDAERRLQRVICDRFGLPPTCPKSVRDADRRIRQDERAALLGPAPRPWGSLEGVAPLGVRISAWTPDRAERVFLGRLHELGVQW